MRVRRKKKILPTLLEALPKSVRHSILRRKATLPEIDLNDVVVEIAHTREAYLGAFSLVHDAYVKRGWLTPHPSGFYLTQHHALPETTVFVMRLAGRCIGTVSLVLDSKLGLPFERTFPEMTKLRRPGRVLAEIGSLAVDPSLRGSGLTMCLFAALWRYARNRAGVTDLVISVDAHIADYYEGLFGFSTMGEVCSYQGFAADVHAIDDDPVAGLHQDLTTIDDWSTNVYDFDAAPASLNIDQLAYAPFPARWERYPAPASQPDEIRFKMPRDLFQEFFMGPDAMQPLEPMTTEYVLRYRTPQTVSVSANKRGQLKMMHPMAAVPKCVL